MRYAYTTLSPVQSPLRLLYSRRAAVVTVAMRTSVLQQLANHNQYNHIELSHTGHDLTEIENHTFESLR